MNYVMVGIVVIWIIGIIGLVANIVQIVSMWSPDITAMLVLKIIGIFIAPLGSILGIIGMF